jgi:hypothetical protein
MELIKQVCTLEQAKKLAQLGVVQEGVFSWGCNDEFDFLPPSSWTLFQGTEWRYKRYSAFTVAELEKCCKSISI